MVWDEPREEKGRWEMRNGCPLEIEWQEGVEQLFEAYRREEGCSSLDASVSVAAAKTAHTLSSYRYGYTQGRWVNE
jgi:hypothetical protein